jgi:2-polyprenyl-3-methyl-5-hydroxy-6-metoxy-1,4-benzoquinol methylase
MGFIPLDLEAPAEAPRPDIEWEESPCLLCGGRRWSIVIEAPDPAPAGAGLWFAVVQCQDCGLCFTNPRPSARSISQFYTERYLPHRTRRKHSRWWRRLPLLRRRIDKRVSTVPWNGEGRLLDFGCGGGVFLALMHRRGWRVTGLDTSAAAVQRVRTELGLRALTGSLPHPELPEGGFDMITMWQSLEHVHDPVTVLRAARGLLAPGGRLVVETPNIDSLPFRWFGQGWFGLDLPRHLTHFVPETLCRMLHRAGFRTSPVRMVRHSDWLRSSARLAARLYGSRLWLRCLRMRTVSGLASWLSYLTGRADCIQVTATADPNASPDAATAQATGAQPLRPTSRRPGDRFHNR